MSAFSTASSCPTIDVQQGNGFGVLADETLDSYKSEAKIHSVEQKSAVGGDLEGQYFDQDGHRIMGQIAAAADMAGLT